MKRSLRPKFVSILSDLILATPVVSALYFVITGHRLLTAGGTFPWCLKDDDDDDDTHLAVLSRWHAELQISVLDVSLTEVVLGLLHEMASHGREGAVRSHDQVSILQYSFISGRPVRDGKFGANAKIGLVQGCEVLHRVYLPC